MDLFRGQFLLYAPRWIFDVPPANLNDLTETLNLYQSVDSYLRPVRSSLYALQSKALPLLMPLLNRLAVFAQDSPAVVTLALLLVVLVISLQILNFAKRVVMFWTKIFVKILFYGILLVIAMTIYQRGIGAVTGDLMGWGQEIVDVWWREYRKWDGYQNESRKFRGNTGGYVPKNGNAGTGWR